jgi:hypothetical protein
MKALILYVLFVTIGVLISIGIGYSVEIEFSSTASLIVFLALFFANFGVSWLAVILVMDGTLKDAQGRQAQLNIEKSGRAGIALREANAIAARKIVIATPNRIGVVFGDPEKSPFALSRPDHRCVVRVHHLEPIPRTYVR